MKSDPMEDFHEVFGDFVAAEAMAAVHDEERMTRLVGRLAEALGTSSALLAKGEPRRIGEVLSAAHDQAQNVATDRMSWARKVANARHQ